MGKNKVTVVIEQPDATAMVAEFRRHGPPRAGSFGLRLSEAKGLLAAVQSRLTRAQLDAHVATQLTVLPEATHVLDGYQLTRKLTHIRQLLFGEEGMRQLPTWYHDRLFRALSALKWHLWHDQRWRARRSLQAMLFTMRLAGITGQPLVRKMRRHAKRLSAYLETHADSLPDYGRRHRTGESVASSFIESAVNQLVDKRESKSQPMRWSHPGAHRLLQVRAEVVDGRLGEQFERWYPGFARAESLPATA